MRAFLLLLLLPALSVQAAPFPLPLSPERPVSDAVLHDASGDQHGPALASNGEIGLVAWHDRRDWFVERIYATRVDAAGNSLDPAGILLDPLGHSTLGGVVWNGTHFAVALMERGTWMLVFVAPDGTLAGRRALDIQGEWADSTDGGPGVRMLFLTSGDRSVASIVDGAGEVIARGVPLLGGSVRTEKIVAGSRGSEFLVLVRSQGTDAVRIDGVSGRILSTRNTSISDVDLRLHSRSALEGGPAGWVLVAEDSSRSHLMLQKLDVTGVASGAPAVLFEVPTNIHGVPWPRIIRESGQFTVAWSLHQAGSPGYTYVAFVTDEGLAGPSRRLEEWPGYGGHVRIASAGGVRLLVTTATRSEGATGMDLFAQAVTDALAATEPAPIARSPLTQSQVTVAAGGNGYLTGWVERGPDSATHLLVRRVLPDGTLQGPPLEAGRGGPDDLVDNLAVVSNGSRYLVAWRLRTTLFGRRMAADTGLWIDAAPFVISEGWDMAVASNGTDAIAAWSGDCRDACIQSRRIRMAGDPLTEPALTLLEVLYPTDLVLASNGTDYLLAWVEGEECWECFEPKPREVLALRLRADATKIDGAPLVLVGTDAKLQPGAPVVAWNAGRYLVAWEAWLPDVKVEGALVTAEGAIVARRVPLVLGGPRDSAVPRLLAHRNQFLLFTLESTTTLATSERVARWTAASFDAHAPLETVAALARSTIVQDPAFTLGAASSGPALLVVYDRVARPESGVARAYTRLFGGSGPIGGRRRAVR